MERNTLIAVVLSVIVITVGFTINTVFFTPEQMPSTEAAPGAAGDGDTAQSGAGSTAGTGQDSSAADGGAEAGSATADGSRTLDMLDAAGLLQPLSGGDSTGSTWASDIMTVRFNVAGEIVSYELTEHLDDGEPVNMIYGSTEQLAGLSLFVGAGAGQRVDTPFRRIASTDPNRVVFEQEFAFSDLPEAPFTIRRDYSFDADEYMFELRLTIATAGSIAVPLDEAGIAYRLGWGPQIGPEFQTLDGRTEYRRYLYHQEGRRRDVGTRDFGAEGTAQVSGRVAWGGIAGKYFVALGIPDGPYTFTVSQNPADGAPSGSQFAFVRPAVRTAEYEDVYRFYVGPKDEEQLDRYDRATDNAFGYVELDLGSAVDQRRLLGWLEDILKFGLEAFYRVVPNYGVAIIILTILVKLLLFPLTKRSHESMAKMQEFQPKIQELREKYGNDQQKLNQETTKLYQANGINPLGGCLPLILQIPFFIAMFGLFNTSFDLRGATFIPGWITDLSAPESIWNFGGYQIPLLGWTDLRLLPILFVGTQLLSTFFTQAPQTQGSGNQQALMMYGLPIIFFFVLYDMPSGLLVYWIMQNVLTAGQQYVMRRRRAAHH